MHYQRFYVIFTIIFAYLFCACDAYTAAEIYNSLADEDKGHFLRYYLAKGFLESEARDAAVFYPALNFPNDLEIPEDTIKIFQHIEIEPQSFPVEFYHKFMEKYNLTKVATFEAARKPCTCTPREQYICIPQTGQCIDVGDVGGICCT